MEKTYEKPLVNKVVLMANERVAADCDPIGSDPIPGMCLPDVQNPHLETDTPS